jgi:phosphohistidine phosphatase
MDRLILLRHAKAEADAPSGDDFDRPLAPRGVRESRAMALQLATLGLEPDVALVSPALRTRQTWEAVAEAIPGGEVRFDRNLYNADASALRRIAEQAGEGRGTLILVGHNPGLQELAARLIADGGGPASLLHRVRKHFPPAAAAVFDIDAHGRPSIDGLYYPERES